MILNDFTVTLFTAVPVARLIALSMKLFVNILRQRANAAGYRYGFDLKFSNEMSTAAKSVEQLLKVAVASKSITKFQ